MYISHYENFGQTILEAAATGLPIISTSVGVARELVEDGENGYLVDDDNPAMIADRVNRLLDIDRRKRCGKRLKELVKERYSWGRIIDGYVKMYEEII